MRKYSTGVLIKIRTAEINLLKKAKDGLRQQIIQIIFWKHPHDVPDGVRTRSQEKEPKKVKIRDYDKYFQNL